MPARLGDDLQSFLMDLQFNGIYRSFPILNTQLATQRATVPLIESTFCHFVVLKVSLQYHFDDSTSDFRLNKSYLSRNKYKYLRKIIKGAVLHSHHHCRLNL